MTLTRPVLSNLAFPTTFSLKFAHRLLMGVQLSQLLGAIVPYRRQLCCRDFLLQFLYVGALRSSASTYKNCFYFKRERSLCSIQGYCLYGCDSFGMPILSMCLSWCLSMCYNK